MKITNMESNNRLKSQQFLQSFNDYVQGLLQSFQFLNGSMKISNNNSYLNSLYSFTIASRRYLGALSELQSSIYEVPYRVIERQDDTRLLHYHSQNSLDSRVGSDGISSRLKYVTPLLIVYAPINRYHIMDLNHSRSIVEKFASAGFDVYLLDWGLQTNNKPAISDYVDYIRKAVKTICNITKSNKVNLLGYSWGGTLSVMYAAGSDGEDRIQNLIIQSS